jgi:hypothetical protein
MAGNCPQSGPSPLFSCETRIINLFQEDLMKPLGKNARNWLMTFHILFVAVWIGAALFTIMIRLANQEMQSSEALYTLHMLSNKSDLLIIPSGVGVLITSLMISIFTKWGFFKFRWMTVVWIIFLGNIIVGGVVLGPLKRNVLAIVENDGLLALQNPIYIKNHALLSFGGILQVTLLALAILIIEFKPWGRRRMT